MIRPSARSHDSAGSARSSAVLLKWRSRPLDFGLAALPLLPVEPRVDSVVKRLLDDIVRDDG